MSETKTVIIDNSINKIEFEKKIDSYLAYIKGELINNFSNEETFEILDWSKRKISDTIKDRKEKEILKRLKVCSENELDTLKRTKKKYLPENYPENLQIGDIVYVNYGFGYCSEMSQGHYGIILSEFKINLYLVLPLSSEPLLKFPKYLDGLKLPNKDGMIAKRSYLMYNQLQFLHYRRLENINGCNRKNIGHTNLVIVIQSLLEFLKFDIDKTINISYNNIKIEI